MLRNQDRPMIAFVLQSARKKDFASAKVKEGAAGGQMLRLSKEFESVNKLFLSACRAFFNFRTCEIFLSRALQYKRNHWPVLIT